MFVMVVFMFLFSNFRCLCLFLCPLCSCVAFVALLDVFFIFFFFFFVVVVVVVLLLFSVCCFKVFFLEGLDLKRSVWSWTKKGCVFLEGSLELLLLMDMSNSRPFDQISHTSVPKLTFWSNFIMVLHGFASRNPKHGFSIKENQNKINNLKITPPIKTYS